MLDTIFDALREGNPIYWGGFLIAIFFLFKFFKRLGKFGLVLLILAIILYTIFFFYPEFFEMLLKQAQDVTEEINLYAQVCSQIKSD